MEPQCIVVEPHSTGLGLLSGEEPGTSCGPGLSHTDRPPADVGLVATLQTVNKRACSCGGGGGGLLKDFAQRADIESHWTCAVIFSELI